MRRHPALQDLSRDHHVVLLHARRLRGEDARVDAATERRRFQLFHANVLRHHFAEEEQVLVPCMRDAVQRERLLREHAELNAMVAGLAQDGDAVRLGELLRAHIRFEEDEVFEGMQRDLSEAELDELGLRARTFRATVGRSAAEECFL